MNDEDSVDLDAEDTEALMDALAAHSGDEAAVLHDKLTNESGKANGKYRPCTIVFHDEAE